MLLGDWAPRVSGVFTEKQQLNSFSPRGVSAASSCCGNPLAPAAPHCQGDCAARVLSPGNNVLRTCSGAASRVEVTACSGSFPRLKRFWCEL